MEQEHELELIELDFPTNFKNGTVVKVQPIADWLDRDMYKYADVQGFIGTVMAQKSLGGNFWNVVSIDGRMYNFLTKELKRAK